MLRLHRGYGAEARLTPDRLSALWEGLGHYPIGAVRDGVTAALREPKLPWYDRLAALVEDAYCADRRLDSQRCDQQAQDLFRTPPAPETDASNRRWAGEHLRAIQLLLDGRRAEAQAVLTAIGSPASLSIEPAA
jgi:hypothetical protein